MKRYRLKIVHYELFSDTKAFDILLSDNKGLVARYDCSMSIYNKVLILEHNRSCPKAGYDLDIIDSIESVLEHYAPHLFVGDKLETHLIV